MGSFLEFVYNLKAFYSETALKTVAQILPVLTSKMDSTFYQKHILYLKYIYVLDT